MLSVIICTYNRAASLDATLRSLEQVDDPPGPPWEIVVVDNNSGGATAEVLREWTARSRVRMVAVREPRQGKSAALNRGIAAAHGDILAFTDDDVQFDRAWLRSLVEPFTDPAVMGVGGKVQAVWPGPVPRWWAAEGPYRLHTAVVHFDLGNAPAVTESTPPIGANMAYRRTMFERYGGFREDLGPTAAALLRGEDTEFARRLIAAGERLAYAPGSLVYHPVERIRARKPYFRRWYFDYGRTCVRREGGPSGALWFGVPRYLFRELARGALKAARQAFGTHAFFWELQVFETAGRMYECWRSRRPGISP